MYESKDKMVSHPDHYQSANGLEVIDCIEAFTAGLDGIEATDTGNIIKYACRWKKKNGVQDLEKILWYTQHLIDYLRDKEKKSEDCQKGYMPPFKFELECDAMEALSTLKDVANADGYVTVADVYDASELSNHVVARYASIGWSYDDIAATEIYEDTVKGSKSAQHSYWLKFPCEPYDVKYKDRKECKEDSIPPIEEFQKWFNDELEKRGYVFSADLADKTDICVHANNCKAFDKEEN